VINCSLNSPSRCLKIIDTLRMSKLQGRTSVRHYKRMSVTCPSPQKKYNLHGAGKMLMPPLVVKHASASHWRCDILRSMRFAFPLLLGPSHRSVSVGRAVPTSSGSDLSRAHLGDDRSREVTDRDRANPNQLCILKPIVLEIKGHGGRPEQTSMR